VEWSGVEWSGVEWSGVEWSGVEWSGVEWSIVDSILFSFSISILLFLRNISVKYLFFDP
jgi:hypothetical protein